MPRASAVDALDGVPLELRRWLKRQRTLPATLADCSTLYQVVRRSRDIPWQRKVLRAAALTTWVTLKLIRDVRTRPYIAKLIHDDVSGLRWTVHSTSAVSIVVKGIESARGSEPARTFKQHRSAALKALRGIRAHLDALGYNPRLSHLLEGEAAAVFRRAVENLERAEYSDFGAAVNRMLTSGSKREGSDSERIAATQLDIVLEAMKPKPVPDLQSVLNAAISQVARLEVPKPTRHGVRALYLRSLFADLAHSEIASRRVAFLSYASEALFDERIEKRTLRRLVADIGKQQNDQGAVAELFARACAGVLTEEGLSSLRRRRERPLI